MKSRLSQDSTTPRESLDSKTDFATVAVMVCVAAPREYNTWVPAEDFSFPANQAAPLRTMSDIVRPHPIRAPALP